MTTMERLNSSHYRTLKEIFEKFDLDSDGSLTKLELAALLRSIGLKPTGDKIHSLLNDIDANDNGSIEFEELALAIAPIMNEQYSRIDENQLKEIFKSFDLDGNGVITAPEFARMMAKLGQPLSFDELNDTMNKADTDGDGVINYGEFKVIMEKSAEELIEDIDVKEPTPN
ncbi:putative calcium-binding protein CML14 [Zostera marina]|uniref:Putative calcium-binding protein CML14 n=1 Tax=Zostera marina TaxID=29655 RepID=A0A0K9NRY0_ZOSMR|nr:putative calcium-binding protein CML14 [Zostera marina]